MDKIKKCMLESMKMHSIDAIDLLIEETDDRYIPVSRKLHDGTWLPILTWSFVSFDPTQQGFAINK